MGQEIMFLVDEVSCNRVPYIRGFVSNHKEQPRQGQFFCFLISEVSCKRGSYKQSRLYHKLFLLP